MPRSGNSQTPSISLFYFLFKKVKSYRITPSFDQTFSLVEKVCFEPESSDRKSEMIGRKSKIYDALNISDFQLTGLHQRGTWAWRDSNSRNLTIVTRPLLGFLYRTYPYKSSAPIARESASLTTTRLSYRPTFEIDLILVYKGF